MAITSVGYPVAAPDDSISATEWADMQATLGEHYWVKDQDAAKVTVVGSAARTVRVASGRIGGHGVLDTITATAGDTDIQLPDPASGTVYYTIVARRVWQTTNATTLTYVTGSTSRAIASAREVTPGTIDDHPLALVAVTAGNPTPSVSADLRAVGTGGGRYEAYDTLTLGYMNKPGYVVRIDGTEWLRLANDTWTRSGRPRMGWFNDYTPHTTGTKSNDSKVYGLTMTTKDFPRLFTISALVDVRVSPGGGWRSRLVWSSPGDPDNPSGGTTVASELLYTNSSGGTERQSATMTAKVHCPANETRQVKVWMEKVTGGTCEILNGIGRIVDFSWVETSGNDW